MNSNPVLMASLKKREPSPATFRAKRHFGPACHTFIAGGGRIQHHLSRRALKHPFDAFSSGRLITWLRSSSLYARNRVSAG